MERKTGSSAAARSLALAWTTAFVISSAAAAPPRCEQTFLEPGGSEPLTLAVQIDAPEPDAMLRRWDDPCRTLVTGVASAVGIPTHFDYYLVIDGSGSTFSSSGVDADGDGNIETILGAETLAARLFLDAIQLSQHSVAVIVFDSHAMVVQPLTSSRAQLDAALDAIDARSSGTSTNFGEPMERALAEHATRHHAGREQVILFMSDGDPNVDHPPPPGAIPCSDSSSRCTGIQWAAEAHSRGITVTTFAIGATADPGVLSRMAVEGGGQFFDIDVAGEIAEVLPQVVLVGVRSVEVQNRTTGLSVPAELSPDGGFSALVGVVPGLNDFVVTATTQYSDAWTVSCDTSATFTCMDWTCPSGGTEECGAGGLGYFGGLIPWASERGVRITNDSPVDDATADPADASGFYPLGGTRVTWTLDDDQAGEITCAVTLRVEDTKEPEFTSGTPFLTASCSHVPEKAIGVSDACDPSPSVTSVETRVDGPCPDAYDLVREYTATDSRGNVATFREQVAVRDDEAPELFDVPADETVECPLAPSAASVTALDSCDPAPVVELVEAVSPGGCPGESIVRRDWTARDRCGNAITAQQLVHVVDTTPPTLLADRTEELSLWAPRHRPVRLDRSAFHPTSADACDPAPTWRFVDCSSNQPDDDRGDGHTVDDCIVEADGSALLVRPERAGPTSGDRGDDGRAYTVSAVAVDSCGNVSSSTIIATIRVAHDRRR